jgi:hypothetical protein
MLEKKMSELQYKVGDDGDEYMSELERMELCQNCNKRTVMMFSGSGTKGTCMECGESCGYNNEKLNLARKGGVFNISPYELEQMSAELIEINNIFSLAKADDGVKKVFLLHVVSEFKDDLYDFFPEKIITDDKLDNIVTIVEENLDYEHCCRNPECETCAYIDDKDRDRIKRYIKREIMK